MVALIICIISVMFGSLWLTRTGLKCFTTVLMDYKNLTSNSFEKCSNMFFLSLFSVWLSILLFHVKLEQFNHLTPVPAVTGRDEH